MGICLTIYGSRPDRMCLNIFRDTVADDLT